MNEKAQSKPPPAPLNELEAYADSMRRYLAKGNTMREKSPEFCWKELEVVRKGYSGKVSSGATASKSKPLSKVQSPGKN
jgi:hypothetical protein